MALLFVVGAIIWGVTPFEATSEENAVLRESVRRGTLSETVEATGVLEPSQIVQLGAQTTGQVKAIHVRLGQPVKAGDLIAEIDSRQQQNELRLARAGLTEARATQQLRQLQLEKANRTLERQRTLHSGQAGSGADLQDADTAARTARVDLDLAAAAIEKATVEVEKAETNLRYTRITAPMDGRIIALVAKPGQTLNAAQTTPVIAVIAQTNTMTVRVQVSETDVGRIKVGQAVRFSTFGDRLTKRESVLSEVQPAPSTLLSSQDGSASASGTGSTTSQAVYYNVLFEADNADGALLPMMTAEVAITVASAENALLAPLSTLDGPDAEGFYKATVRKPDGVNEIRRVRIGLKNLVDAEIVEGLSEGEEIVLRSSAGPTDTETLMQ